MSKSNITPEKLAKVAEMVKAQKAKADAEKAQRKALVSVQKASKTKELDAEKLAAKAAKDAERAEKKALRDQERSALKAELEIKRAAKKAEREAAKAAKAAERANRAQAWQRKIERLRAALPEATENLTNLQSVLTNFSDVELTSALAYVEYERRVRGIRATAELKATEGQTLNVGDKVLIKNCNARKFIGQVGVVDLVRRIRAFVVVPGFDTKAYVFTSDVELLEPADAGEMGVNILDTSDDEEAPETATESTGTEG
jgi:DNA polymerase III alpha subunit (gram-positive type)